jgi:hypothetical protein
MKNNYKTLLALGAVGLVSASLAAAGWAQAASMTAGQAMGGPADREAIDQALASGDYEAWKALVEKPRISDYITKDNFSRFVEMHNLMQAGKTEEAEAIRTELGLPERPAGMGRMMGKGRGCAQGGSASEASAE